MAAVADGLAHEFPETNTGRGITIEPLRDVLVGTRTALPRRCCSSAWSASSCSSAARTLRTCLLARATARQRELAVRSALGASRSRVVRQLLTETVLLSLLGGALGLAIGAAILQIAPTFIPPGLLPAAVTLRFDAAHGRVLLRDGPARRGPVRPRAGVAGDGRAAVSGDRVRDPDVDQPRHPDSIVARRRRSCDRRPAALRRRPAAAHAARRRSRRSRISRRRRAHDALRPAGVASFRRSNRCSSSTPTSSARSWPCLASAASAGRARCRWGPLMFGAASFEVVGEPSPENGRVPMADFQIVAPGYFQTLDLPLVAGRSFDDRDVARHAAGLHRQRGVRPHSSAGPIACWHTHRHADSVRRRRQSPSCGKSSGWRGR